MGNNGTPAGGRRAGTLAGLKKGEPKSPVQALEDVNKKNFFFSEDSGYTTNCQRCIWAYEMSRRGYDVEAKPNHNDLGLGRRWTSIVDGDLDIKKAISYDDYDSGKPLTTQLASTTIEKQMRKWGSGTRGAISFARKNNTGHLVSIENIKGHIVVYDSQSGNKTTSLKNYLDSQNVEPISVNFFRTDTVKFNDKEVSTYVRKRRETITHEEE